jgi:hypothetical protein
LRIFGFSVTDCLIGFSQEFLQFDFFIVINTNLVALHIKGYACSRRRGRSASALPVLPSAAGASLLRHEDKKEGTPF